MASFRPALTEAPQRMTEPHWDRPVNSGPRPCHLMLDSPYQGSKTGLPPPISTSVPGTPQLAYGSPVFATGGITPSPPVIRLSRITRTQQSAIGIKTPLDHRYVRPLGSPGLHEDHTPSLQLYEHDWYCYGACRTGGSIYDLGALLYGLRTRGHEFLELRQRLAEELLPLTLVGPLQRS